MQINLENIGILLKVAYKSWWSKDPFKESAVIAYYAIFALPGLLLVIMTVAGYFFGEDAVNDHLAAQISSAMGADAAQQIQVIIASASQSRNSVRATTLGLITIFVGATGVFIQFQKSLNVIWEVKADVSKSGIWSLIKERLFSFGLLVAIAFIMTVSFMVTTVLILMGNWLSSLFSDALLGVIEILNFIVSRFIIVVLFALMFKVFPDAKVKWRHVWWGSIVTAILFLLGMYGLSLYFTKAAPGIGYGSAGSIILILLWVSYSSMIVFFGAELTYAYAVRKDGYIPPDKNAVARKVIEI